MRINLLSLLALSFISFLPACDDDDDSDDNADATSDGGGGGGDGCEGPLTDCPLAELSEEQQDTYCDAVLAAIDDEPGTKYTCDSDGMFLAVNTAADCRAGEVSPDCPITVGDIIDCYKAAKNDACAAFAADGACGPLFSQGATCF
jgi:hypothetical protein